MSGYQLGLGQECWEMTAFDRLLAGQPETCGTEPPAFGRSDGSDAADLDADPYVPIGHELVEHVRGGWWTVGHGDFELLAGRGRGGAVFPSDELLGRALNANAAFYLFHRQRLIDQRNSGRRAAMAFLGTRYRRERDGRICVIMLVWENEGDQWRWLVSPFDFAPVMAAVSLAVRGAASCR